MIKHCIALFRESREPWARSKRRATVRRTLDQDLLNSAAVAAWQADEERQALWQLRLACYFVIWVCLPGRKGLA